MRIFRVKSLIPAPKDGEKLYLVVKPTQLVLDNSNNWKGSTGVVTVEVWRQKGNEDPTQSGMGDYRVNVYKNGTSSVKATQANTPSFTFEASKSDTSYEVELKVNGKSADSKTISISKDGANGGAGGNTATVFLFRRSASAVTSIDWSNTLTYTFATQALDSVPSGWTLNKIPSGTDPIYVTAATAYSTGATDTIAANEWAAPVLFVQNGGEGGHGLNSAPVFLFKRGATAPAKPSSELTYTFSTGVLSGSLSGWSQTPPSTDGNPCWVIHATAAGTGATDTIAASEWSEQQKYVEDGGEGPEGHGIALTLTRNDIYTDAQWGSYGAIGHSQSYAKREGDAVFTTCRVGDCFVVAGTSSDTGKHHSVTYRCTAVSANSITGTSISYVKDGDAGAGISSTTWYYLATTMATGVTRSTSGWTSSYQQATPELPYVWRYGDTLLTNGSHQYTSCELVFSYSAGANPNLLEQTNFSSLQALGKWHTRNSLVPLPDITVAQESFASIETGTQAHNAYYDRTTKTSAQIQYKEILCQCLWSTDGSVRKLEPSTWYTLSFWAKGDHVATFIYPSVFDNTSVCYKDGVMLEANSLDTAAQILWSLSGTWTRHTFTFKTKSTIGNSNQNLLFRIYPKTRATTLNSVYICMPKLEVGLQATSYISNEDSTHTGQLRRRRWALNTEYFQGAVDERYDDVVLVGEGGFYHCIKSHISTLDNKPGIGDYWQTYWTSAQSGMYEMLSTDLFFANKALINNLIATLIQTGYSGSPHIEAEGSEFKIFGRGQYPAIYLAVNSQNQAVLRFQNENTGEFLYDLGPDGIMKEFSEVADTYTQVMLKKLTSVTRVSELLDIADSDCTTYYRFNEGYKQIGSGNNITKQYHVSGGASPSAKNAQYFTTESYSGNTIANGWYVKPNNGVYMMTTSDGLDQSSLYIVNIYQFSGGKLTRTVTVYFKYTDSQRASQSVGCDESGNELNKQTYAYLYSYADSQ